MSKLSEVANLATCISLILYLMGIFTKGFVEFINSKRYIGETLIWNPESNILNKFMINHNKNIGSYNGSDKLLLYSEKPIYKINVYEVQYTQHNACKLKYFTNKQEDFKKKKTVFSTQRLLPSECISFNMNLPEGIPNTMLTWESQNYMKAELILKFNGKTGNISESVVYKRTVKSFLYYIFGGK